MTNWQQVLRDNDPFVERMDADAAARIRERVVRSADAAAPSTTTWRMRFALAAFACVVLMMSMLALQRPVDVAPGTVTPVAGSERRQIQFAMPGGTRIIWEINPDFTLGETIP